jgi:HSP20 family protein
MFVGATSAPFSKETLMANITRFDEAFDDLLRGFFVRPVGFDGSAGATAGSGQTVAQFRVDVAENEQAYTLRAEIPGVSKDDIHITIDGDQVAISAEVKNEKEAKDGERVLRTERYYGKVYRAFQLAQTVDENGAAAKYTDGILELTLPKKAAVSAKRISIQ